MRPESYRIRLNDAKITAKMPLKVIQGHLFWYQSKAHMRLPISG